MVKKTITIAVDIEIYLELQIMKSQGENINISEICNEALKSLTQRKDKKPSDELEKEVNDLKKSLLKKQALLNNAKEQEKNYYEEEKEKAIQMDKALKNARVLDFD
jgi:hypothetical protein